MGFFSSCFEFGEGGGTLGGGRVGKATGVEFDNALSNSTPVALPTLPPPSVPPPSPNSKQLLKKPTA